MEPTRQTDKAPLLRDLPSRLLVQAATLVGQVTTDALAKAGSHRHQFAVLATLDAFGPSSQAELCRRTDLDRSDMNAILNTLQGEGAVGRKPDTENRRRNIVTLTDDGARRLAELKSVVMAAQDIAFAPLAPHELEELKRLLGLLHDHLATPG